MGVKTHGIEDGVELFGLDRLHRGAVAVRTKALRGRARRKTTRSRSTTTTRCTRRLSTKTPQIGRQCRLPAPFKEPREPVQIAIGHNHGEHLELRNPPGSLRSYEWSREMRWVLSQTMGLLWHHFEC